MTNSQLQRSRDTENTSVVNSTVVDRMPTKGQTDSLLTERLCLICVDDCILYVLLQVMTLAVA